MATPEIDIVVTWVDMNDPAWKAQFHKYKDGIDNSTNQFSEARFRDYGLLRYWFRGMEKFAPWVRKIHFVTCGQKPAWLDTSNPKLNLVHHKDYIPEEFLPTFSSSLIELYFHRIPGIADRFIYFNDDVYVIAPTAPERFFKDGLPCDIAAFRYNSGIGLWSKCLENNIRLINRKFNKKEVIARDHDKWFHPSYGSKSRLTKLLKFYNKFITLKVPHSAYAYLKQSYEEVWAEFGKELTEVSKNSFRTPNDLTQELFRTWQICQGNFSPLNVYDTAKMFPLVIKPKKAIEAVRNQKYNLVCLNDNVHIRDYDKLMSTLEEAFQSILPEKSSFEL